MKYNMLCVFAALLLIVGCKNKSETGSDADTGIIAESSYLSDVVGVEDNGVLKVKNPDKIKKYWNDKLKAENIAGNLKDIEIIRAKPIDTTASYYVLVAKSEDKKTKVSAFLVIKDNEFYFERPEALSLVICQGCIDGCNPIVSVHNGTKSIVCSPCLECVKGNLEIY